MTRPIQVVAVSGGKGGVGKSNIAINLGVALADSGKRVVLLDADFGLANVDVLLGLKTDKTIEHVLDGSCSLQDILLPGPAGVKILPASSGTRHLSMLSALEHAGLIRDFSDIANQLDVLVIDTAAGISDSVINFLTAANEVLMVVCNEPSSITDVYALIKILNRDFARRRFRIVANMVADEAEGRQLFDTLNQVCGQFLNVALIYAGTIPFDVKLRESVKQQVPVLLAAPSSPSARALSELAQQVNQWPLPAKAQGHLVFFVEQLLAAQVMGDEAVERAND
ncbi:Flagellum site-determining protein YlxH [Zhongshania aliphaticivorans]|uniref:Flagellum site-determining protein YlxH n=1 Tax=Zhongshania aliphaticivorans TaxID=1470434 RepID=A0A5S9QB78_9GAMM|nr:MinD/ParA family protein [Zhongshania aliphaticivorans]CAA0087765.1 Flagellum site-determining protein YlxH [Zhongshania aliphaticivorans]CAA0115428.1 Flagellum site-determining protein YlxH [Zhongshania aliphaticivorans]CAA0120218.1 Flagellum site-determining protein YlxH [Zhongshania aliphaticivorans]